MEIRKIHSRSPLYSLVPSILLIVIGGGISCISSVLFIVLRFMEDHVFSMPSFSHIFLIMLLAGVVLLIWGLWNFIVHNRYRKLRRTIDRMQSPITLSQLSEELGTSSAQVLATIRRSIDRRFWSGYGIAESTLILVDSGGSYNILAGDGMTFEEGKLYSRVSIVLFAVVWALYAVIFGFGSVVHVIICSVLSVTALIAGALLLDRQVGISHREYRVVPVEPEVIDTGDESADEMLKIGVSYLAQFDELYESIRDDKMAQSVQEIRDISRQIFDFIHEHPEKARRIRQFINYYLPTTIRLLKNYEELDRQAVKGDNIKESMQKIEGVMQRILFTFHEQLDDLYRDKNIDISADITVMENMLKQESLSNR